MRSNPVRVNSGFKQSYRLLAFLYGWGVLKTYFLWANLGTKTYQNVPKSTKKKRTKRYPVPFQNVPKSTLSRGPQKYVFRTPQLYGADDVKRCWPILVPGVRYPGRVRCAPAGPQCGKELLMEDNVYPEESSGLCPISFGML